MVYGTRNSLVSPCGLARPTGDVKFSASRLVGYGTIVNKGFLCEEDAKSIGMTRFSKEGRGDGGKDQADAVLSPQQGPLWAAWRSLLERCSSITSFLAETCMTISPVI